MKYYLAIDIGASSGRHIVGWIDELGNVQTDEVFRFPNEVTEQNGHLLWDVEALFRNILLGAKAAFQKYAELESLSIDTWGVDYVLLNGDTEILPCYAYRDSRTAETIDKVHKIVSFEQLYAKTGIAFESFNSVYQLYWDKLHGRLNDATDFLMLPEYFSYKLTGVKKKEYTDATTTGLVNAETHCFDAEIISKLGLPQNLFGELSRPGTVVGQLKEDVADFVGGQTKVVLCASHDTASAVEGIPMDDDEPYISSGTWSLLGVKTQRALTDENSCKANYSNEGGVGYTRYQKNIMGMWVVNQLRKELCPDKPFGEIVAEAQKSDFRETVDVNAHDFFAPTSMKSEFDNALTVAFKPLPKTVADYFNCAYLSLAQCYKQAIDELESNVDKTYKKLYIVGGGAKNAYLNDLTEKATGKKVVALPIEATALGNLKMQIK